MSRLANYLSLFTSAGTLICCALPSLLVSLGMGASLVGLISHFPQLIWLSNYKAYVFTISGCFIIFAFIMHYKSKNLSCPADPKLAKACMQARKWSFYILSFSVVIWLIGAFFAFLAPIILA